MELLTRILGLAQVEIRGAEPELLLDRCASGGISLQEIRRLDGVTLSARLREGELPALRQAAEGCGCQVELISILGGSRDRSRLRRRRALVLALLLWAALLPLSSLFVWEIRVEGCKSLSQGKILRTLAECGVEQGSFRPSVSVDLVRSRMLAALPELAWMTVNFSGSRATVLVREREEKPELYRADQAADIVAACPGVIRSMTVLNGRSLVQPGDAVLEGELLVTGEMEGLTAPTRSVRALAEIQADTWRELTAVCPVEMLQETASGRGRSHFSLQIGKNRLKFGPFPGKGLDECDKIVHEYTMGIKGLLQLPVTLVREERRSLSPTGTELNREEEMEADLLRRLEEQIDGEILEMSFSAGYSDGLLVVTLRAHCLENIAQTVETTPP